MPLTEMHVHDVYVTAPPPPGWVGPVLWGLLALVLAAGAGVVIMARRRAGGRAPGQAPGRQ